MVSRWQTYSLSWRHQIISKNIPHPPQQQECRQPTRAGLFARHREDPQALPLLPPLLLALLQLTCGYTNVHRSPRDRCCCCRLRPRCLALQGRAGAAMDPRRA